MGNLSGKVAIVTGAGRGIGRAIALRLAQEGCSVVVDDNGCGLDGLGVDPSVAAGVVDEIERAGGKALARTDDVGDPAAVDALFAAAIERFGHVDVLVASAGILADVPILEHSPAVYQRMMDSTLRGTYHAVAAMAKHLVGRKSPGRILTITSGAALRGASGIPIYSAAKAGIIGLTLSTAMELKDHGITVNTISPLAYTRLTAAALESVPNGAQVFSPDRIADVVAFLASDAAAAINGAVVDVSAREVSVWRYVQSSPVATTHERWTQAELAERWPDISGANKPSSVTSRGTARSG